MRKVGVKYSNKLHSIWMLKYTIHQNDTQKHEVWNLISLAWSQPANPELVVGCRQECRFSQQCCRTQLPDPDRTFGCRHACLLSQPPLQNTAGQSNHWVGVRKHDYLTNSSVCFTHYWIHLKTLCFSQPHEYSWFWSVARALFFTTLHYYKPKLLVSPPFFAQLYIVPFYRQINFTLKKL